MHARTYSSHTVIFNCLLNDGADYGDEEPINSELARWPIRLSAVAMIVVGTHPTPRPSGGDPKVNSPNYDNLWGFQRESILCFSQ